jgi:putative ABC transport system permease protein
MIDLALNDLREHKLRTGLTILGVIIAIASIVSLGSISAGMNLIIESGMKQLGSGMIIVSQKTEINFQTSTSIRNIDESLIDEFKQISGVARVAPIVRKFSQISVIGIDPENVDMFSLENIKFEEGGWFEKDQYEVVIGKAISDSMNLKVGDTITIRNKEFEVVGVFEDTGSSGGTGGFNFIVAMPYAVAQEIYDMKGEANAIIIKPDSISDTKAIKNEINERYDDLQAMTTEDLMKRAQNMINRIGIITIGIGVVTSIVAAIGIIITMITSIHERKKQIGIMKAVGAETNTILMQILEEGLIISVLGGIIGLLIGGLLVGVVNDVLLSNMKIASITFGLAAGAFFYGIFLSVVASLYPAWQATKVNPVEAMRE